MLFTTASFALLAASLTSAVNLDPRTGGSQCHAQANQCRTKPGANQSYCSAQLAQCLGESPYKNTTIASTPTQAPVYTTEVVTSFETYCPEPTTLVHGSKTYTVTEATTLTITDCPCTLTKTHEPGPATEVKPTTEVQPTHVPSEYPVHNTTILPTTVATPTQNSEHPVYTTEIVTSFTTYCPYPTTVVHGSKTYTVTEATTLTITDCPCTLTKTEEPKPTTEVKPTHVPTHYPLTNTTTFLQTTVESSTIYVTATPAKTTEVVTSFTTFCPYPTTVVHGSKTYTVTEATTLTITDCPCTITKSEQPSTIATVVKPSTAVTSGPAETVVESTKPVESAPSVPVTTQLAPPVDTAPVQEETPSTTLPIATTPSESPVATSSGPVEVTNAASLKKPAAGLLAIAIAAAALS